MNMTESSGARKKHLSACHLKGYVAALEPWVWVHVLFKWTSVSLRISNHDAGAEEMSQWERLYCYYYYYCSSNSNSWGWIPAPALKGQVWSHLSVTQHCVVRDKRVTGESPPPVLVRNYKEQSMPMDMCSPRASGDRHRSTDSWSLLAASLATVLIRCPILKK